MALLKDRLKLTALISKFAATPGEKWCEAPTTPPSGPEWYLRLRDRIFYESGARD
jgi:hypothetical protein